MDRNDLAQMRQLMQPGGIAETLKQEKYEGPDGHRYSEAALVADVINIMRLNTKQLGAMHDVDIEINRMTEEHAAKLLERMARENDLALVEVFEVLEQKQDDIIKAELGEERYHEYLRMKETAALSIPESAVSPPYEDAEPDAEPEREEPTQDAESEAADLGVASDETEA